MKGRQEAIEHKLAKANTLLAEIEVLMQHRFYMTVVNSCTMPVFMLPKRCC